MRLLLPHIHHSWILLISPIIHQLIEGADEESRIKEDGELMPWLKLVLQTLLLQTNLLFLSWSCLQLTFKATTANNSFCTVPNQQPLHTLKKIIWKKLLSTSFSVIQVQNITGLLLKSKQGPQRIFHFFKSSIQANNSLATLSSTSSPQYKMLYSSRTNGRHSWP